MQGTHDSTPLGNRLDDRKHNIEEIKVQKVKQDISSARFVYPFVFDTEDGQYDLISDAVETAVWSGQPSVRVWTPQGFKHIHDLLPHIADFLTQDGGNSASPTHQPSGVNGNIASTQSPTLSPTARFWTLNIAKMPNAKNVPAKMGAVSAGKQGEAVEAVGLPGRACWTVGGQEDEIEFVLEQVQLGLFSHGVGFLTLSAKPTSERIDDWQDFLYIFHRAPGDSDYKVDIAGLSEALGCCVRGTANERGGPRLYYDDLICSLLGEGNKNEEREALRTPRWWDDTFVRGRLIPHAAVYLRCEPLASYDGSTCSSIMKELLYKFRMFYWAGVELAPAKEDLEPDRQPGLIPYARLMWFCFSLSGGIFVAFIDDNTSTVYTDDLPRSMSTGTCLAYSAGSDPHWRPLFGPDCEISPHNRRGKSAMFPTWSTGSCYTGAFLAVGPMQSCLILAHLDAKQVRPQNTCLSFCLHCNSVSCWLGCRRK